MRSSCLANSMSRSGVLGLSSILGRYFLAGRREIAYHRKPSLVNPFVELALCVGAAGGGIFMPSLQTSGRRRRSLRHGTPACPLLAVFCAFLPYSPALTPTRWALGVARFIKTPGCPDIRVGKFAETGENPRSKRRKTPEFAPLPHFPTSETSLSAGIEPYKSGFFGRASPFRVVLDRNREPDTKQNRSESPPSGPIRLSARHRCQRSPALLPSRLTHPCVCVHRPAHRQSRIQRVCPSVHIAAVGIVGRGFLPCL